MRIVIDLQSCQSGSRLGGIGRYSIELVKAMARNSNGHELWVVYNNLLKQSVPEIRHAFSELLPQDRIIGFELPSGVAERRNSRPKVRAVEVVREEFIANLNPDMVLTTSLFEGYLEEVVTSVGAYFDRSRVAVILYDLIPLVQRERYLSDPDTLQYYMGKVNNLKNSGLLLSISEFSREEVIDLLGFDSDRVVNISSAADQRFKPTKVDSDTTHRLKSSYGIKRKFLMYTGSFDQRKNHENLIRAFGLLPKNVRNEFQLVIVGNGWDGIYQQLKRVAKDSGLHDEDVVFAGRVSDADLLPLYNLCHLFIFPSLAEGFGLPVLEAMSCGTPTICSNCTSLPEVVGRSDAVFDPRNPRSITEVMLRALTDNEFRLSLRIHGIEQAKNFSWDLSARRTIRAFERHHQEHGGGGAKPIAVDRFDFGKSVSQTLVAINGIESLPIGLLKEISSCIAVNRNFISNVSRVYSGVKSELHVGWVSTWNTRCGIAAYTKFIVDKFAGKNSVFAPKVDVLEHKDDNFIKRCWNIGELDDLKELFDEIIRSGVNAVVIQFNYGFFNFYSFVNLVEAVSACGVRVYVTFHSTRDPFEFKRLSLILEALRICKGLFVHAMNDVNVLTGLGLSNIVFLPQGVADIIPLPPSGIDFNDSRVIATYGFALPSKGLLEVIEAFSILDKISGTNYHLLMVNSEYGHTISSDLIVVIKSRLAELGIQNKVTLITDYLADEVSLGYLSKADLIVFGYQDTGESSSAAVRMGIASGTPVAVTPVPIFDDVSGVVFKLPGTDPLQIANGITDIFNALANNDDVATRVSDNLQHWRHAHNYQSIANSIYLSITNLTHTVSEYEIPPSFSFNMDSEAIRLKASQFPIQTQVGLVSDMGIKTNGKPGYLIFGPGISIDSGIYKVVFCGLSAEAKTGCAKVDVVIDSGSVVLAEGALESMQDGQVFVELLVEIPPSGSQAMETRVYVDEYSDFCISHIDIIPYSIN